MCDICCEKFTVRNKKVKCQYCDFEACRTCHKLYVFGTNNEMHCMGCKKEWTDDYVADEFSRTFYNKDLKQHRENIIVEREKILLPEAQECMERYEEYKKIQVLVKTLEEKRNRILTDHGMGIGKTDWGEYNRIRNRLTHNYNREFRAKIRVTQPDYSHKEIVKPTWTWACPSEECRGFLDDTQQCGVCKTTFCKHCNEEQHPNHTCDPDQKKSIQFLKKDSRPCPTCATVIHKINGCDQMWCPDCKSAFSWKNGTVEVKHIHNPHYYEFLRNTQGHVPRAPGDNPDGCENRDHMPIVPNISNTAPDRNEYLEYFFVFTRGLYNIRDQWNGNITEEEIGDHVLKFLRVKYLAGDITEQKWKWTLQKKFKAARKCNEINMVFQAIRQVGLELFWDTETTPGEIVKRAKNALEYFNTAFEKISKRLNCMAPNFILEPSLVTCITFNYSIKLRENGLRI